MPTHRSVKHLPDEELNNKMIAAQIKYLARVVDRRGAEAFCFSSARFVPAKSQTLVSGFEASVPSTEPSFIKTSRTLWCTVPPNNGSTVPDQLSAIRRWILSSIERDRSNRLLSAVILWIPREFLPRTVTFLSLAIFELHKLIARIPRVWKFFRATNVKLFQTIPNYRLVFVFSGV